MQELFGRVGLYVEVAGVLLAILSFSGASTRIEQVLARLRDDFRRNAPLLRHGLSSFLPTWGNIKRYGLEALWQVFTSFAIFAAAAKFQPEAQANLDALYALLLPWTTWKIAATLILIPPAAYTAWAVMYFLLGIVIYALMSFVWRVFCFLSRPPSVVMGSI